METEKKSLVEWVKEHKKELVIAGISVTMLISLIFGLKNKSAVNEMATSLRRLVGLKTQKKMLEKAPVCVGQNIVSKARSLLLRLCQILLAGN